jgi:hypothetical protein
LDAALADRQSLIIELNSLPIGALQLEFRDEKPPICSISWQLNEVQRQSSAFVERCRSFIADFARRAYACESVEFVPDNSGLSPAKRSPRRLFDEAVATAHAEAESLGHSTYQDPTTGYQVFTRAALLARGYCCGSGCRHCPYSPMN